MLDLKLCRVAPTSSDETNGAATGWGFIVGGLGSRIWGLGPKIWVSCGNLLKWRCRFCGFSIGLTFDRINFAQLCAVPTE